MLRDTFSRNELLIWVVQILCCRFGKVPFCIFFGFVFDIDGAHVSGTALLALMLLHTCIGCRSKTRADVDASAHTIWPLASTSALVMVYTCL